MTVVRTTVCDRCKAESVVPARAVGTNWEQLSLHNRGTLIDLCDECFALFQRFLDLAS